MPILNILIAIIVVGVILWLINNFIPMQGSVKKILNAVVIIILVIWLLNVFGVLDSLKEHYYLTQDAMQPGESSNYKLQPSIF